MDGTVSGPRRETDPDRLRTGILGWIEWSCARGGEDMKLESVLLKTVMLWTKNR